MEKFDYIIGGVGCAGLNLAFLMNQCDLKSKKVLLIDVKKKSRNDRTFCFWENDINTFEEIVYKTWSNLEVIDLAHSVNYKLDDYKYKMIRGLDLYNYVKSDLEKNSNFRIIQEKVIKFNSEPNGIIVKTNKNEYYGKWYFNSIPDIIKDVKLSDFHHLTQHFLGYFIETKNSTFDTSKAIFMDFSVKQGNDLRFCYILPYSSKEALVEYTIFSKQILKPLEYQEALKKYLNENLAIKNYKVTHKEFGKIPMTNYPFPKYLNNRVINIGIPGGGIKPSCGFGFKRMQDHASQIIHFLQNNHTPKFKTTIWHKRHKLYNSTFLNVLSDQKINKKNIFIKLFKKNRITRIFKFLDEKTNVIEEIKFFCTTHKWTFLKAIISELFILIRKKIFRIFNNRSILLR